VPLSLDLPTLELVHGASPDAVLVLDASLVVAYLNGAARALLGLSGPGDAGGPSSLALAGVHLEPLWRALARVLAGADAEGALFEPTPGAPLVSASVSPLREAREAAGASRASGACVVVPRASVQAASAFERAFEEQASELQTVLDLLPVGLSIARDPACRHTTRNRYMAGLIGVPPEQNGSLSAPLDERPASYRVLDPSGRELAADDLPMQRAAARREQVVDMELVFEIVGKGPRTVLANAAPLLDREGRSRGAVGAFVEVTELAQARRRAEEANQAKDEFLATLSHELRTPLTAVLGWSMMLLEREFDAALARKGLEVIARNAQTQVRLVEDLIDVGRMHTGRLSLHACRLDLGDAVAGSLGVLRGAAEARGLSLQISAQDAPLMVVGDPDRLQQIVWNLVANAIKFSPRGGRIEVLSCRDGGDGLVRVVDHGAGLDAEALRRLFEPFWQADPSTTRRHGGLGLGLAIVKQLAELHGGSVSAASEGLGKGASFTVRLPLAPGEM
jgi:signal transduction histidine kinase